MFHLKTYTKLILYVLPTKILAERHTILHDFEAEVFIHTCIYLKIIHVVPLSRMYLIFFN